MEDDEILKNQDLDKIICQECGLPLILFSYEQKVQRGDCSKEIYIKLICKNNMHKTINKIEYGEYNNLLQKNFFQKICKCSLCNKFIQNNVIPLYCYDCKKIICSDCSKNNHQIKHELFKYEEVENKCLIHFNKKNDEKTNINFFCVKCKKVMCEYCKMEDKEDFLNNKIEELIHLNQDQDISQLQKETDDLKNKISALQRQLFFNELLIKNNTDKSLIRNNNNITNINNNEKNLIIKNENSNLDIEQKWNKINVIYHNENLKNGDNIEIYPRNDKSYKEIKNIIFESHYIEKRSKCSIILSYNLLCLDLILKYIPKTDLTSKLILIVNGWSSEDTFNFIKEKNYLSLFESACIYCLNKEKYRKIKEKYSDFYQKIYVNKDKLVDFIDSSFEKVNKNNVNGNYYINPLINEYLFKAKYSDLKKMLYSYNDKSKNKILGNKYLKIEEFPKEIENILNNSNELFSKIKNNSNEEIIKYYLNNYEFAKIIDTLLKRKEQFIYQKIGNLVGILIYSLIEYCKKNNKQIKEPKTFYSGMQLNIIELLEFLKNYLYYKVTFPNFLSMTTKKDLAELTSKRNIALNERNEQDLFSVIFTIKCIHDNNPCIIEVKDLSEYPEEEEYILLPFSFFLISKINIDTKNYMADIELEIINVEEKT